MQKQLAKAGVKTEYTLKLRVEETVDGFVTILTDADGKECEYGYYQETVLDALESGAFILKSEAEKLLKTLQEMNQ